jgi:hypothetical protein
MTDPMRSKALARLRSNQVMIRRAFTDEGEIWPSVILALVRSSRDGVAPYVVDLSDGWWRCTCRAGLREERCPHVLAVQMVTGHQPREAPSETPD